MSERESLFASRREQLRRAVEDGERLYRKRMHDPDGDGLSLEDEYRIDGILTRELESALALVDGGREALVMLRDAWNAHMATCPHHNALPDFMRPTPADIQSWIDAPSNTASATVLGRQP